MDKSYQILLPAILFFIAISGPALATPYTGADIVLAGTDYSSIYGGTIYDDLTGRHYGWGRTGNETIYTNWPGWVEYSAPLTPGNWNIGLNAINHGDTLGSDWYSSFEVSANLTPNQTTATFTLSIPASSTEANHSFFNFDIETAGEYTVKYSWENDKYSGTSGLDANIEIVSAFFDNTATGSPVPEPASILLFGTGLIGLTGLKKRRNKGRPIPSSFFNS
ncbi:MAG TPA: PEP-CTERM sorting domain-containing protein [Desulfobacterales bacterium]|nr:PEP-CTERM sorting domain-containing protein [Desulfobacterales bacterium]